LAQRKSCGPQEANRRKTVGTSTFQSLFVFHAFLWPPFSSVGQNRFGASGWRGGLSPRIFQRLENKPAVVIARRSKKYELRFFARWI
jgi:hypothetical protein